MKTDIQILYVSDHSVMITDIQIWYISDHSIFAKSVKKNRLFAMLVFSTS
jgi:hypothetical protein